MKGLFFIAMFLFLSIEAQAVVIFDQTRGASTALLQSSAMEPNGSDYDRYVWDNFTLSSNKTISKVAWRGGYDPAKNGSGGPVLYFTVAVYASIPAGTQPTLPNPLVSYNTGGNAGETSEIGNIHGYQFTLPQPFQALAGKKYWLQIEAFQKGIPDWGIVAGSGDGVHFTRMASQGGDIAYYSLPGDAAFTLSDNALAYTVTTTAGSNGTISPSTTADPGSSATFTVTPNENYYVADVLVDGVSVGPVMTYTFTNIAADHTIASAFALLGDLDLSGSIDLADAILAMKLMSNLDTTGQTFTSSADINSDGKIGLDETIYILQKMGGLR